MLDSKDFCSFIVSNLVLESSSKKKESEMITKENIESIIEALAMDPYQDYRDTLSKKSLILRTEILTIDNLNIGQKLEGSVKNVTHFGAFVDIGIGKDALLHQSQFRPGTIKLGNRIDVLVKSIEKESQRIGLTLVNGN